MCLRAARVSLFFCTRLRRIRGPCGLAVGPTALAAAFLCAVADATGARSQCSFPLHVLPSTSALRRLLDPLSAPASPVASRVTLDALTGPLGSDSDDEVWLAPAPPPRDLRLFLPASPGAVADASREPG